MQSPWAAPPDSDVVDEDGRPVEGPRAASSEQSPPATTSQPSPVHPGWMVVERLAAHPPVVGLGAGFVAYSIAPSAYRWPAAASALVGGYIAAAWFLPLLLQRRGRSGELGCPTCAGTCGGR